MYASEIFVCLKIIPLSLAGEFRDCGKDSDFIDINDTRVNGSLANNLKGVQVNEKLPPTVHDIRSPGGYLIFRLISIKAIASAK